MRGNVHSLRMKQKLLLRLYSEWQETRHETVQLRCLALLGEILAVQPLFNLRKEFQSAF